MTDVGDQPEIMSSYRSTVSKAIASWIEQGKQELIQFSETLLSTLSYPQDALDIFNSSIMFSKVINSQYLKQIQQALCGTDSKQMQSQGKPNQSESSQHFDPTHSEQQPRSKIRTFNTQQLEVCAAQVIQSNQKDEKLKKIQESASGCDQRKGQITSKIIELQKMISPKKEKMFKSDRRLLWFCDMSQIQIEQQVNQLLQQQKMAVDTKEALYQIFKQMWVYYIDKELFESKLYQQQLKQFLTIEQLIQLWEQKISNILFDNEVTCKQHGGKVYYVCSNDYLPNHIYLCNLCILHIKENNIHKNHKISCKKHKQYISWKVNGEQDQQSAKDKDQLFACASCRDGNKAKHYSLISKCHFSPIQQMCTESNCIHSDKFLICPCDGQQTHKSHQQVHFDKQSLIKKFGIYSKCSLENYGQVLEDIKQRLKLRPVVKMVGALTDKMWQAVRYLESYNIDSDDRIRLWIDQILKEGSREDMGVLLGARNIQNMSQQNRRCFLEVFKDKLEQEQEKAYSQIWQIMLEMGNKVQALMNMNEAQVNKHLDDKYRRVQNVEGWEKPMRLECISHHYGRIQEIVIDKEIGIYEQDDKIKNQQDNLNRKQHLSIMRKEKRKLFFTVTVSDILRQKIKDQQIQQKILNYIINNRNGGDQQLLSKANLSDYEEVIQLLYRQLKEIEKQFEDERKKCIPLLWIIEHKLDLTSLQIISITHRPQLPINTNLDFFQAIYDYCVDAFALFQAIHNIPALRKVTIIGVEVRRVQSFAKCRMAAVKNADWLREFKPSAIALSINAIFQFNITSYKFYQQVEDASSFFGLFKSVGCVTAKIQLNNRKVEEEEKRVKALEECFSSLQDININIKDNSFKNASFLLMLLLLRLPSFPSVRGLGFSGINFSRFEEDDYSKISDSIAQIFSRNTLTALKIHLCRKFPALPKITSLQLINFDRNNQLPEYFYRDLLLNNPSLKAVQIREWLDKREDQLDFSRLAALDYLRIHSHRMKKTDKQNSKINQSALEGLFERFGNLNEMRMSFIDFSGQLLQQIPSPYLKTLQINNSLDKASLSTLQGHSIKVLHLSNNRQYINQSALEGLFERLHNLAELIMWKIDFSGKLLQRIPSPNLTKLEINGNRLITNDDIWVVDCKWPHLTRLKIWQCDKVDGRIFGKCKFKGLIQLYIDYRLLEESDSCLQYLTKRGIKVVLSI